MYNEFKAKVLGKVIGDGECVSLVVNNPASYTAFLFPGVAWENIMAPVAGAKDLAGKSNQYLTWIVNNHSDPNQLPSQGDIMVFGATPAPGYTATFPNPYGHCGIYESGSSSINLLSQNSPTTGAPANVANRSWKYSECLGWYRPNIIPEPTPAPAPAPSGQKIYLPPTTGPWHLYKVGGPYNPAVPADVKGVLVPSQFGGLTYAIVNNRGNGVYTINTEDYGQGDLWTKGSDVVIS